MPTAEQPLRLAEFDALFSAADRRSERLGAAHLRVTLAGDADLAASVRDLAAREVACCSFFTFSINSPAPGQVQLDIEVSAGHVDVLDALEDRAATAGGGS